VVADILVVVAYRVVAAAYILGVDPGDSIRRGY
jgi:hypothetical protein